MQRVVGRNLVVLNSGSALMRVVSIHDRPDGDMALCEPAGRPGEERKMYPVACLSVLVRFDPERDFTPPE